MRSYKLSAAVLGAALSCASAQGREAKPADVVAYVNGYRTAPNPVECGAKVTASWMFAKAGIRLIWRNGQPPTPTPDGPVVIQVWFVRGDPPTVGPDDLAYALPFGNGVPAITVMYSRIRVAAGHLARERSLLAHVLAHEIAHVLQRANAHARTGVMKGHWDQEDLDTMQREPLRFTPTDVALMKQGLSLLKRRATSSTTLSSPGTPPRFSQDRSPRPPSK